MDPARQNDHRSHADGAPWRIQGSAGVRAVAALAGFGIRNWRGDPGRWRFLRFQRRVGSRNTTIIESPSRKCSISAALSALLKWRLRCGPGDASGVIPLPLPLIYLVAVDPVLAILSLFQLATLLAFFPLLAAIAHNSLLHSV